MRSHDRCWVTLLSALALTACGGSAPDPSSQSADEREAPSGCSEACPAGTTCGWDDVLNDYGCISSDSGVALDGGTYSKTISAFVSNGSPSCSADYDPTACTGSWVVAFDLPSEMQAPGMYALSDAGAWYLDPNCGGGPLKGMLHIASIDAERITGWIAPSTPLSFETNGNFSVSRCK